MLALTIVASSPSTAAISIRIGPYHFVFGSHGHRPHRHAHSRPRRPTRVARPAPPARTTAPAQGVSSAWLYPQLALPAVYDLVFASDDASIWPFDYRSIFLTGFHRTSAQPDTQLCRYATDLTTGIDARIRAAFELDAAQTQRLRNLESALGAAADNLAQACPSEIPTQPIARLELMDSQIGKMLAALDRARQPLQDFQNSLNDEQRARFATIIAARSGNQGNAGCGSSGAMVDWSVDQIDRAVQPTETQRDALHELRDSFAAAARNIAAHCLASLPPTEPSRLEEIVGNLAVMQQAVASIRVALGSFAAKLSDAQKARFDAINFGGR